MNFNPTFTPPTTGTSAHKTDPDKTYPCLFFFVIETTDLTLSPEVPNLEFNIYHRFCSPFCQLKRERAADFIDILVGCHVFTRLRAHAQQLQWVAKTTSLSTLISPLPDFRAFSYSAVTWINILLVRDSKIKTNF